MGLREIISGATNAEGKYDDVYLPKKAGLFGTPATEPTLERYLGAALVVSAGALAFRLWRSKGPGRRKLQRARDNDS